MSQIKVLWGELLLEAVVENLLHTSLLASWGEQQLLAFLDSWTYHPNLCLLGHMATFSPSTCLFL